MNFWEKPLDQLTPPEWEALCDGCGKCCLHKAEDEDSGRIYPTNVACRLLDRHSGQCTSYANRRRFVPDCVRLTRAKVERISWLPRSCAYRLRGEGLPLPAWHYLISGDREAVHRAGQSVRGWTVAEADAGDWENHLVDREL
ncbi:MAG: YcgN family cysteine cluster protein [Sphingobium sp.]